MGGAEAVEGLWGFGVVQVEVEERRGETGFWFCKRTQTALAEGQRRDSQVEEAAYGGQKGRYEQNEIRTGRRKCGRFS